MIKIFVSQRKLEGSDFDRLFANDGISQECRCRVHQELTKIDDVQSIMAFAKISEVVSNAEYLEMKDPSDTTEYAEATWPFYEQGEQIERRQSGRFSEAESS